MDTHQLNQISKKTDEVKEAIEGLKPEIKSLKPEKKIWIKEASNIVAIIAVIVTLIIGSTSIYSSYEQGIVLDSMKINTGKQIVVLDSMKLLISGQQFLLDKLVNLTDQTISNKIESESARLIPYKSIIDSSNIIVYNSELYIYETIPVGNIGNRDALSVIYEIWILPENCDNYGYLKDGPYVIKPESGLEASFAYILPKFALKSFNKWGAKIGFKVTWKDEILKKEKSFSLLFHYTFDPIEKTFFSDLLYKQNLDSFLNDIKEYKSYDISSVEQADKLLKVFPHLAKLR